VHFAVKTFPAAEVTDKQVAPSTERDEIIPIQLQVRCAVHRFYMMDFEFLRGAADQAATLHSEVPAPEFWPQGRTLEPARRGLTPPVFNLLNHDLLNRRGSTAG
jgi:hypothetical protein